MFTHCGRPHEIPCVLMRHRKFNHDICGLCFCASYKRTFTRCNGYEPRITSRTCMLYLCCIWNDGTRQDTPRIYYQCAWPYSLSRRVCIRTKNGCIPKKKIVGIKAGIQVILKRISSDLSKMSREHWANMRVVHKIINRCQDFKLSLYYIRLCKYFSYISIYERSCT